MNYSTKSKRGFSATLILLIFFLVGNIGASAQDEVVKTLDFTAKSAKSSDYTKTWDYDDLSLYGGANYNGGWAYVRFGGKAASNDTPKSSSSTIASKSAISSDVDYINIEHLGINGKGASSFKITSIVLEASEDSKFENIISTTTVTPTDEELKTSTTTKTFSITPESAIPANSYYRITINWSMTNTNNSGLDIQKVVLMKKPASTGPSIKLNPTEYTYSFDELSGSFNYTITNPVADTNVNATSDDSWITVGEPNTTSNTEGTVSFTMQKNETGADRIGTITVKYGDAPEATFTVNQKRELPKYTITWSVNGVTTTETVEEGTALTFAAPTENIPAGYEFMGWYGSTLEPQNNAPTYVTEATATADATYYAVFAKNDGGTASKTVTLEPKHTIANTTYADHQYTDSEGNTWNAHTSEQTNVIRYGLRSTGDTYPYFESPEFGGNITKIEIRTFNSSKSDRVFYIDGENSKDAAHIGTITAPHNEECTTIYSFEPTTEIKKFYLHASDAVGFNYLAVTYGGATYSDFRTSVTPVETMTIDMTKTYNNDGIYYRTFSSTKAFKVPADLSVSEIAVFDGQLLVDDYKDGDVVAANTGVMLWSLEQKEFTVDITTEEGTTILGADNMLRPSGDAGITAADMAAKDAKCIFYRLTTNKDDVLCYAWGAADGAAFALDANKAYLAVPTETAQGIKAFSFGGNGTTAIDKITDTISAKAERKVYNLQGQRVSGTPAPGLYIVNGKKVVIK